MNRGLKAYEIKHKPGWEFNKVGGDWAKIRDFEGVLNTTRTTSTLAQIEHDSVGVYTCLINRRLRRLQNRKLTSPAAG